MTEKENWTVKEALDWTCGYLERKGDENPRLSAEWLLSEACGMRRIEIYLSLERPLSQEERAVLRDYVSRRGKGEPLQYISGTAPFRYLTVRVSPGVLIPRPETEVLVSEALLCLPQAKKRVAAWSADAAEQEAAAVRAFKEALSLAASGFCEDPDASDKGCALCSCEDDRDSREAEAEPLIVADVCTGSGCIACAIASEREDTRVLALDISPEATALARENVAALGLADRVAVLQGDLGEPVPERFMGKLDLVVSNPPYVPTEVLAEIPTEVSAFEPELALDGGADGLDLVRRLTPWCFFALKSGGYIAFELYEGHMDQASDLASAAGFSDIRVVDDLAGRPRVLIARKPEA